MRTRNIILSIFITTLFTCCNSGVFIDNFISEYPDTCHVVNGKPYKLNFDSDNWNVLNVYSMTSLNYDIYDLDGNKTNNRLPLENGETAIISYRSTYYKFHIEKRNSKEIIITCDKNLENYPISFSMVVGNQYTRRTINVLLNPTNKFVIDKVEYDFENDFYYSNYVVEQVDGMTVNNSNSEGPITLHLYPFKNSLRKIKFAPDDYEIFKNMDKILGENLAEIPIPDIVDEKPVVRNTKATFGLKEQSFWTGRLDKDFMVSTTVQPGETKNIEVYNNIEEFHVNYRVYASNPDTGEEYIFKGRLYSEDPFDYLMIFPKLDLK
ncbi:hypothetical protein [uncultured Bacteroides sp.]|uniref:hypothetical protein n=1 Tax=uncultured Bacteroides sp. TaxID=162156 RepID=UPI00262B9FA7|nr:hypothetical protein [uncultured Bacteroides sp.]